MAWCPEEDIESKILEMYSDAYLTFEEYDQITADESVSKGIVDDAYCDPKQNSVETNSDKTDELYLAAMVSDLKIKVPGRLETTNDLLNKPNNQKSIENEITSMLRNCGNSSYKTTTFVNNKKKNQIEEDDFIVSNGLPILLNRDYFQLKPQNEENGAVTKCITVPTPTIEINNMESKLQYNPKKYKPPI